MELDRRTCEQDVAAMLARREEKESVNEEDLTKVAVEVASGDKERLQSEEEEERSSKDFCAGKYLEQNIYQECSETRGDSHGRPNKRQSKLRYQDYVLGDR